MPVSSLSPLDRLPRPGHLRLEALGRPPLLPRVLPARLDPRPVRGDLRHEASARRAEPRRASERPRSFEIVSKGASTSDVHKIVGFFDPLSPLELIYSLKSTQPPLPHQFFHDPL